MHIIATVLASFALIQGAFAQAPNYGQCGGTGWTGPTTCLSGWSCVKSNEWYSQCLPGGPTTTPTTPTTTTTRTSTTTTPGGGGGGSGPGPTLLPNYLWIRAVAAPNFHKYLQSYKPLTASDAILGSTSTAGQFNIVSGKLVQLVSGGSLLYGVVETRRDSTVNKLKLSWSANSADTTGTFAWSGDALQWTISGITRPNNSAWLACVDSVEGQVVYANLGSYGYQTPAGCADQTIHYYNGATATE
ncbi:carbohydrate-binding module family 1 protein [Botryobasidium botryosum FD-172 SS1]|uniref:Carbohydrate-binding module family 1 protein n=1 Tax=Botryobasidium botryosum (strain FD-172 SS1) TaxID=930990 RepID=A0A067MYH0_BOTB1|nr:carbohydrate-binding module family 1 protein [Botryobasidium botryosum FD-172 SS1]